MEKHGLAADFGGNGQKSIAPVVVSSVVSEKKPFQSRTEGKGHHGLWRRVRHWSRQLTAKWRLEIASIALSAASYVAIALILIQWCEQSLHDWPYYVSLNTVISILSTAMKASLGYSVGACLGQSKYVCFKKRPGSITRFVAFDEASRGLLGCVPLLFRLKLRYWASLGACVIISLVTFDPVIQATVFYQGESSSWNSFLEQADLQTQPSLFRASQLDIGAWQPNNKKGSVSYHGQENVSTQYNMYPDTGMTLATLNGFINSSTTSSASDQQPPMVCPGGNCTWPIYSTLEICSECADISSHIVQGSKFGVPSACGAEPAAITSNYTTYAVSYGDNGPGYVTVDGYDGLLDPLGDCQNTRSAKRQVGLGVVLRPNQTYSFRQWDTLLAAYAVVRPTDDYYDKNTPFQSAAVAAAECAFRFCGRVHFSAMRLGIWVDSLVEHGTFVRSPASFQLTGTAARALRESIDRDFGAALTLGLDAGVFARTDLQLVLPQYAYHDIVDPDIAPNYPDMYELGEPLQDTLKISQKAIETMMASLSAGAADSYIAAALASSDNLTATFAAAAQSMTIRMRRLDAAPLMGIMDRWVLLLRPRWGWLAVPGLTLAAAFAFLVATMQESRMLKLEALKDSPLEALVHGPDDNTRRWLREQRNRRDAADMAVMQLHGGSRDMLELRPAPGDKSPVKGDTS